MLNDDRGVRSSRLAFDMAGVRPIDVDVAQIYERMLFGRVLMTLEDHGFCNKGGVYDFVRDGQIEFGGRLRQHERRPVSETGMPGMQLIHEGVRQMRGSATLQVPGCEIVRDQQPGRAMHARDSPARNLRLQDASATRNHDREQALLG